MRFFVLFLFILTCTSLYSQQDSKLTGYIIDSDSVNIPFVQLELFNNIDTARVTSSFDGKYIFTDLKNEDYKLIAKAIGYEKYTIELVVREGRRTLIIKLLSEGN